ncbi:MAG TPA: PRTRC system protein B [Sphingobium sp.]
MPDHSTHFEAMSSGMILTNAILLYRSQGSRNPHAYGASGQDACAFASIHAVGHTHEDHPVIAAGVPLTRAHLRQWTEALGRSVAPELLPTDMLVAHTDMLAWWVPAQVRPAWFALSSPPDGLRVLHDRIIAAVPYPAHLFVANRSGLGVYALPTNERPTAETRLLNSPILNVFVGGQLCWGNIPKPRSLTIASIPDYERAVFESWSTHPNPGQERTVTGKGGLIRLWDGLAARGAQRFPVSRLKPLSFSGSRQAARGQRNITSEPVTVGALIARWNRR